MGMVEGEERLVASMWSICQILALYLCSPEQFLAARICSTSLGGTNQSSPIGAAVTLLGVKGMISPFLG